MKSIAIILAAAMLVVAPPASAADGTIRASDPKGIVSALEAAGYDAKLEKDNTGDPMIEVTLGGWASRIYFYECDAEKHDSCRSLQFSAGFDRKEAWSPKAATDFVRKYRFAGISLDDEGDPYVTWDVITDDGIPTKVFLSSVLAFTETLEDAYDAVFADEPK